jgi:hypothetical protein
MTKKKTLLHKKTKMKEYKLKNGRTFWASHDKDAELYRKKVGEK